MKKICPYCKKEFETQFSSKMFCGSRCSRLAHERRKGVEEKKPRERACVFCGKIFVTDMTTKRYCGSECNRLAKNARERAAARAAVEVTG